MTVCIAAVCGQGKQIVVAADRMLTYAPPMSLEFETEEQKIERISQCCVVMAAGDTSNATRILQSLKKMIAGSGSPGFELLAEQLKNEYVTLRMNKINEQIIVPMLGLDFEKFAQKGLSLPQYLQTQAQVFQLLTAQSAQYNFNVELILAIVEGSAGHIAVITSPGTMVSLDKLGYGAIGSGGIHANLHLSLSGQTRQKDLFETLYHVYAGKKAAESAPGVGQETDLAIIDEKGIWPCSRPVIQELQRMLVEQASRQIPKIDGLKGLYNAEHKS